MKERFTSGNWEARKVRGFDYGSEYNGVGIIDTKGHTMTVLSSSNLKAHDAHLIAQAPAMYEILQKVREEYSHMFGKSPEIKEIDELLAKARGES